MGEKDAMETTEQKTTTLIKAWEDWDEAKPVSLSTEEPKLCKIDNPDCEACQ